MRPDPRVLLAEVDRAVSDIKRFTEGMDRETYVGDARTQAAVERKFEIIGEALNRLHQTHPEVAARIPPLREADYGTNDRGPGSAGPVRAVERPAPGERRRYRDLNPRPKVALSLPRNSTRSRWPCA